MNEKMLKEISNWEKEYLSWDVELEIDLSERQKEILRGAEIKSHE